MCTVSGRPEATSCLGTQWPELPCWAAASAPPPSLPTPACAWSSAMAQTDILLTKEPPLNPVPACQLPRQAVRCGPSRAPTSSRAWPPPASRTAKYLLGRVVPELLCPLPPGLRRPRDQSGGSAHESQQLAAETEALAQAPQQDSRGVGESPARHARLEVGAAARWRSWSPRPSSCWPRSSGWESAPWAATAGPFSIVTDSLQCRDRRQQPDLVRDCVEIGC